MANGFPYDSDEGRALAGAITGLMTGICYDQSARLAERVGAFEHFTENRDSMLDVIREHKRAAEALPDVHGDEGLTHAAHQAWHHALRRGLSSRQ